MVTTSGKTFEHLGRVVEVTHNSVRIAIDGVAGCGSCQAKSVCAMGDAVEKDLVVENKDLALNLNDQVRVILKQSQGMRAVTLGYVFPLIILLGVLISTVQVLGNEVEAGLFSVGAVGIYYLILRLFRKKLEEKFVFIVEKID
ncbi:MAG TPA: SoxR reducing system RseC family protein [Williamwhitmania sp.]|nr:SoxR reducing system RseC family protein [Williamwhitmania sp.]